MKWLEFQIWKDGVKPEGPNAAGLVAVGNGRRKIMEFVSKIRT